MELRRALLLFAIVLGLAAIATSVSRSPDKNDSDKRESTAPATGGSTPTTRPQPAAGGPAEITFEPARQPPIERLRTGRPATVTVKVQDPGEVELVGLGLSAAAEPLTPARFEVLTAREGRYEVRLMPASGDRSSKLGTLDIQSGGSAR